MNAAGKTLDAEQPLKGRKLAKSLMRQKVLKFARIHFINFGFADSSLRGIAFDGGISTGAIFANFDSKEELFAAVVAEDYTGYKVRHDELVRSRITAHDLLVEVLAIDYQPDRLVLIRTEAALSWVTDPDCENLLEKRFQAVAKAMELHILSFSVVRMAWGMHLEQCRPRNNFGSDGVHNSCIDPEVRKARLTADLTTWMHGGGYLQRGHGVI